MHGCLRVLRAFRNAFLSQVNGCMVVCLLTSPYQKFVRQIFVRQNPIICLSFGKTERRNPFSFVHSVQQNLGAKTNHDRQN